MFSRDILGERFQETIKKEERKLLGQFYTPEEIVEYIIDRVEIDINKKIIDLSCGSGRFLLKAYERLYKIYEEKNYPVNRIHRTILKKNLYGIDINPLAVRLTEMNLILKGKEYFSGKINIFEGNSLLKLNGSEEIELFKNEKLNARDTLSSCIKIRNNQFDIAIGNPPYLSYGLKGTGKLEKEWHDYVKRNYSYSAQYKISTYALFIERGIEILKNGGFLGFILPDSFLLGRYFSKLRRFILDTCEIKEIVIFGKDFWKSGLVGKPVILILKKEKEKYTRENNYIKISYFKNLRSLYKKEHISYSYKQNYFTRIKHNRFRLFFKKQSKEKVERLERAEYRIKDIISFSSGLIGKKRKENIISMNKINDNWYPGLHSSSEVNRYIINYKGGYISFEKEKLKSGFKKAKYFEPKLFLRQTGDSVKAAYDEGNLLCLNNLHVGNLINERFNILYILAILNSRLINEYYHLISLETGRALAQLDIETIEDIPIKYTNEKNQKVIAEYVCKVIELENELLKHDNPKIKE
ncbi:MAG: N-6 DNA methylase, partial [Candidatus Helarchaeota archaeon]|nr:N-6 DNA methylase [Candidatus Helarchaeota archaeon]